MEPALLADNVPYVRYVRFCPLRASRFKSPNRISPAIIGTKEFYKDLLAAGIDNIKIKPVVIKDAVNNMDYNNYLVLNFLGRISCADMNKSEYQSIDEGMNLIDTLAIDSKKVHDLNLFLVNEDTDRIVISESAYSYLSTRGYRDVFLKKSNKFSELMMTWK